MHQACDKNEQYNRWLLVWTTFVDPKLQFDKESKITAISPEEDLAIEKQFRSVFFEWKKNPNSQNTENLLKAIHPIIESGVKSFSMGTFSPTIYSKAKLIALESLKKYDPQRIPLKNYLLFQLRGLQRLAAKEQQIIGLPVRVALEVHRMNQAIEEFVNEFGREPTTQELADRLGISVKKIAKLRKAQPGISEGSISMLTSKDDEESVTAPAIQQRTKQFALETIYQQSDPRLQTIIENFYGLYGKEPMSLRKLANQLRMPVDELQKRIDYVENQAETIIKLLEK